MRRGGGAPRGGPTVAGQRRGLRHSRGSPVVAATHWQGGPDSVKKPWKLRRSSWSIGGIARMQKDACKSGDEILQKRYIDNVFDVPTAQVLRLVREALDETGSG